MLNVIGCHHWVPRGEMINGELAWDLCWFHPSARGCGAFLGILGQVRVSSGTPQTWSGFVRNMSTGRLEEIGSAGSRQEAQVLVEQVLQEHHAKASRETVRDLSSAIATSGG